MQLELKAVRPRPSSRPSQMQSTSSSSASTRLDQSSKYTTAASGLPGIMSHHSNNITGLSSLSTSAKTEPSSVTWAPTPDQKSTEIDRIMAKIEQARLSIANVCVLIRITFFLNTSHLNLKSGLIFKSLKSFQLLNYRAIFGVFLCPSNTNRNN